MVENEVDDEVENEVESTLVAALAAAGCLLPTHCRCHHHCRCSVTVVAAEGRLRGQPDGAFLVRPGSKPGTWSLSVARGGRAHHYRIVSKGGGFCLNAADTHAGGRMSSGEALMAAALWCVYFDL